MAFKLLVVDDDALMRESLPLAIPDSWNAIAFAHPKHVDFNQAYHAAMIDMHYGDLQNAEGLKAIEKLHALHPHLEIIAMSGDLNRELMEKTLKAGATRFLAKPLNPDEVHLTLEKIESYFLLQRAAQRANTPDVSWIGQSENSEKIKKQVSSLKGEKGPILIEGETGTGKEVTAHLLHQQNSDGPLITINVAAIPENLFESEFFGHVKGAFTGADQNKMGLAEAANGGTLFIDEIEALPMNQQVKLLRFLESGEVKRVGSKQHIQIQALIIVATNKNLEEMVKKSEFREDLLWRINGKKILLPPLRHRTEDIASLCKHFLSQDRIRQKTLSDDALEAMKSYYWPGNIRELKRCCEQVMVTAPLPIIRKEDVLQILKPQEVIHFLPDDGESIDLHQGLQILLQTYEAKVVKTAFEQYKEIDDVARVLKISRSSLYKKVKDYNLDRS